MQTLPRLDYLTCHPGAAAATKSVKTGIYISHPFCQQKCTYCNFASGVFARDLVGPYVEAVRAELAGAEFPSEPDTLYLGGGTPSLLEVNQLEQILGDLPTAEWREATIEASPGTITAATAAAWARLGIRRVSLGVQSFVPREASAAGRKHTPEQVAEEVALLRRAGIGAINVDLIAGLAHQTEQGWLTSLDWIDRVQPEHVSIYMLERDDESRLGTELRRGGDRYGASAVPSEDAIADYYLTAVEKLLRGGFERYEISNFARPGHESVHNRKYWNMEPYLGFGADAHSFDGVRRWWNVNSPVAYVQRARRGQTVRAVCQSLDATRLREERFFTGLRQIRGFQPSPEDLAVFEPSLRRLESRGWLRKTKNGFLCLTDQGIMFSNTVFEEFLADSPVAGS